MNIATFSPEQMIEFCFAPLSELDMRIAELKTAFANYCI